MMKYNCFLLRLVLTLCALISYSNGDAPDFISGCGITVVSTTKLGDQLYEVVVASEQVLGNQSIRILLPSDYTTSGASRRYPVLYLLHGATGNAAGWTGVAENVTGNASLIKVMPDGGKFGFYTNWIIPGNSTPQNWAVFHMEQMVPWIDLNLRTVGKKQGRSIAGLSMGGYGSIHYAELYTDNFIYAASFSGPVDIIDPPTQDIILGLPGPGNPLVGPFGFPNASLSTNGWFTEDTLTRAGQLRDIYIALYNGDNDHTDSSYLPGNYRLRDLLVLYDIPVYLNAYGDGKSIGYDCDGKHDMKCWRASLINVLPRMMAVLQQQY